MPLYPAAYMLPASPSIPFLLEDVYLRGGYRCVADVAARDAINTYARKAGMRVYVITTGETYTLNDGDLTTWVLVPDSAARDTYQYTPGSAIAPDGTVDFTAGFGKTAMILKLEVTHPDLEIQAHTTSTRSDGNPYKFVSRVGHLIDDGSSLLDDGSTQYNRRFAFVSNLESTPSVNTYWRVINHGSSGVTPTITITYLPIEQ